MEIGVKVGDIMTRDFIAINPNLGLQDAAKIMIKKRVGSLILRERGRLRGLLTERDIIWAMTKKSSEELKTIKVGDLAKKKVTTIKPSADLHEALQKMRKSKYRWLPVISGGNIIGFLTLKDILRVQPELFEIAHAHGAFQIKEEREKLKRKESRMQEGGWISEGICEECGNFDLLYSVDGRIICEGCRNET